MGEKTSQKGRSNCLQSQLYVWNHELSCDSKGQKWRNKTKGVHKSLTHCVLNSKEPKSVPLADSL